MSNIGQTDHQSADTRTRMKKRSFVCIIIQNAALTYFIILALLFLSALIFSGKIIRAISPYFSNGEGTPEMIRWFGLTGAVLYLAAAAGIILFMLGQKSGFYIFFLAALVIFALDLAFLDFDWLRYLIHSGFIFILGIAHFSGRCYNRKAKADRSSDG